MLRSGLIIHLNLKYILNYLFCYDRVYAFCQVTTGLKVALDHFE